MQQQTQNSDFIVHLALPHAVSYLSVDIIMNENPVRRQKKQTNDSHLNAGKQVC